MNLEQALSTIGVGGNTNYFTLKNNRDTETVRFLYGNDPEKLDWFPVYKVKINNKDRYVLMPAEGQPDPFPKYGHKPTLRGLLQLVKVDPTTGEAQSNSEVFVWDRGKTHIQQLSLIMTQVGQNQLADVPIVITRIGAAGDQRTTYQMLPRLDLASPIVGEFAKKTKEEWAKDDKSFILNLSYDDMVKVCQGTYAPETTKQSAPSFQQPAPAFTPPVPGTTTIPAVGNTPVKRTTF